MRNTNTINMLDKQKEVFSHVLPGHLSGDEGTTNSTSPKRIISSSQNASTRNPVDQDKVSCQRFILHHHHKERSASITEKNLQIHNSFSTKKRTSSQHFYCYDSDTTIPLPRSRLFTFPVTKKPIRKLKMGESDSEEETGTLSELPVLKLEGAPSGWNPGRSRRRVSIATPPSDDGSIEDQLSALRMQNGVHNFPANFNSDRRRSTMSFNEWLDLKKFQKAHAAREAQKEEEKNKPKERKFSITFEDWKESVELRALQDMAKKEELKRKEEEERFEKEKHKYKKNITFESWKKIKTEEQSKEEEKKMKEKNIKKLSEEEKRQKSEEAYKKWFIKKELEELKRERDMVIKAQNKSSTKDKKVKTVNGRKGRRGSWLDSNTALQVAANR